MSASTVAPSPQTAMRLVIASLLILATLLFAVGVAVERGWIGGGAGVEQGMAPDSGEAHATVAAAPAEGQGEAGEGITPTVSAAEAGTEPATGETQAAKAHDEAFLGLNLEDPWSVGAFIFGSLLLVGLLLWFRSRVLLVVVVVAGVLTLLDLREVWLQVGRGNSTVGIISGGVAISHAAAAVIALLAWRAVRRSTPHMPDPSAR